MFDSATPYVSAVMPCLNEENTVGICIEKARACFARLGIVGEVVVADNGSEDCSVKIAQALGAQVVSAEVKGYGAALIAGIGAARGKIDSAPAYMMAIKLSS
jgi:glycosyltransferase involved in cell wall biosynthesis